MGNLFKKIKIITIVGARPQFIKAAALSNSIKSYDSIDEVIIHTGQHFDKNMSKIFFDQLFIPKPDYQLKSGGKSHGAMTAYQLIEIEKILEIEQPNYVVLYGDTNSTLSGALAASKLNIPIVHIEAGLRSYNMRMPEEINRILTDRLSKFLFCPSQNAKKNLIKEGYKNLNSKIYVVGDIMLDASKLFFENLKSERPLDEPYLVCTIHRQENTEIINRFKEIIEGLNEIAKEIRIVFPTHPRTKKTISNMKILLHDNIFTTKPMPYIDFFRYIKNCELVITDSGGLQKEAYFMNKNCIVTREETEWTELTENKNNILVGSKKQKIIDAFYNSNGLNKDFSKSFYGSGNTANLIIQKLINAEIK